MRRLVTLVPAIHLALSLSAAAQVSNLRIVTDASPDYHDLEGFIRSVLDSIRDEPFDFRVALPGA